MGNFAVHVWKLDREASVALVRGDPSDIGKPSGSQIPGG